MLRVDGVSVRFGGVEALTNVSIDVPSGEVTGLIGPNGAGKTTLFNVIGGLQPPTRGRVLLDDRDITNAKPHKRARLGIGRTFQRLETFGTLSVRNNLRVAADMRRGWSRERFKPGELVDELLERVGLTAVADERTDRLPTGTQRQVELARALATKPSVLLLDEPSAGLNESETDAVAALLHDLADSSLAILLVEHDMGLVMNACHHIHVLDFGIIIADGSPAQVQSNPQVRAAYLGEGDESEEVPADQAEILGTVEALRADPLIADRQDGETAPVAAAMDGATIPPENVPALELVDVRAGYGSIDVLHGVSIRIPPGRVYALLGPNGAGKTTTLKVASGQLAATAGRVNFFGQPIKGRSADALARDGLCTIPEGRGIFPNLTVVENLRTMTYSGVKFSQVEERAYGRFPILERRRKQVAGTLSGGEQQMLAIARALATESRVLLLDELSMGLAPLIVTELYDVVQRIAAEDVSILIVEQFAHEVLGVADEAGIIVHGRIQFQGTPSEVGDALHDAYLGVGAEE